ncbi:MAG: D-aminoacyl-tRNA deacylase [Desulfurococcales archaeon]|nr:D-aminoacyl-tRNA deacylase [Desulfurococcales archaeon]
MVWKARYGLVYSVHDLAGKGIADSLTTLLSNDVEPVECYSELCSESYFIPSLDSYLVGFDEDVIYFDFLDKSFNVESYVFLSRHEAEAGRKSLTVHHTGNPMPQASHGGNPLELSVSNSHVSKKLLTTIFEKARENDLLGEYEVTLEATHHGPTNLSTPLTFIEIGSTPIEWKDPRARRVIAETVIRALEEEVKLDYCIPVAGYGGGHYPIKHTKIHLQEQYCYGHILAKYALTNGVNPDVIRQSVIKNYPKPVELAIIEKKSLKSQIRKDLVSILEGFGVEYKFV